jgi:azurin
MNIRTTLLAAACALTLAACGKQPAEPAAPEAAPAPPAAAITGSAPEAAPAPASTAPAPATPTPDSGKPAAVVSNCATTIEGSDAMQFNVGSITVPASCSRFTITLKHSGQMPVAAMGHNVVIAKAADMQGVAADGMGAGAAGAAAAYVKAGDARVIAHSDVVGGGQSTTFSFPVASIKEAGPYAFFCTFPGHTTLMQGSIAVG